MVVKKNVFVKSDLKYKATEYFVCPACSKDMNGPRLPMAIGMIYGAHLISEDMNSGGRLLVFASGKEIQVLDQCTQCDGKKIIEFFSMCLLTQKEKGAA